MRAHLDHISFLVKDLDSFILKKEIAQFPMGPIESFEDEGTKEVYIGPEGLAGKLLIMQAIGPGPYQRALEKRGAGLHHIAVSVPSTEEYIQSLVGSGWYIHPASLPLFTHSKCLFLARPKTPFLIEVFEQREVPACASFVEAIKVPTVREGLITSLNCAEIQRGDEMSLTIDGHTYSENFFTL